MLATLRSPLREIARLAALTLMRLWEIRLLRREDVHLEQGAILLPQAKAGARPIILSSEAQKLLRQQLDGHASEWVFPNPDGRPYGRATSGSGSARRRARGFATSGSTTSNTTGRRWRSTKGSRRRS